LLAQVTAAQRGRYELKKSFLAAAFCALAFGALGAGSAFAGEVTGNGKPLWTSTAVVDGEVVHTLHGASACAFSGQEDAQYPASPDYDPTNTAHAQSWGQIPKTVRDFLTTIGSNPGNACNPTKSAGEPA